MPCPIAEHAGSISKGDLKRFLAWAAQHLGYSELAGIGQATPTAELEPLREGQAPQTDEQVPFQQTKMLGSQQGLLTKSSPRARAGLPKQMSRCLGPNKNDRFTMRPAY